MGLVSTTVIAAPLDEVFAWHTRPGALARLSPPWQPVRVIEEAVSLRDGRAVLGLPGGLRWVAQHDPGAYDPPHRFADELVSPPLRWVLTWRHVHELTEDGPVATRMTDRLDSPVPAALLRPLFAYRHRQLADDLAAHHWAATEMGTGPLTVAITGSSGLIGSALSAFLTTGGHRVIHLVRRAAAAATERRWDPEDPADDLLDGVDALVHLAGASIAGRFTAAHRAAVRDSRIGPTHALAALAARVGLATMVSSSAIGFYGADRGDEVVDEHSERGDGFLADVVEAWEGATAVAREAGVRVALIRTGIVQSPQGGSLRLLYPLFLAGLGGRLASGQQWLSWIGIDDLVDVYHRALVDGSLSGPVNGVAPEPLRNIDYTRVLAGVVHRPARLAVPAFAPALLLGRQGLSELVEASQRVHPRRLIEAGHVYRDPSLDGVLRHLLGRARPE
jgi:uncharacterized protein